MLIENKNFFVVLFLVVFLAGSCGGGPFLMDLLMMVIEKIDETGNMLDGDIISWLGVKRVVKTRKKYL